jgi:diguanylate cyclase (GGDEF)-like protein
MFNTFSGGLVLDLYTLFLAVMLLIFQKNDKKSYSNKAFIRLVGILILLVGFSIMGEVGTYLGGDWFVLAEIGTFFAFAFDPLGFLFSLAYIISYTEGIDQKRLNFFIFPVNLYATINILLVTYSELFNKHWFYGFMGEEYYRGQFYMVRGLFHVVLCLITMLFVFIYRKRIIDNFRLPIMAFPFIVAIGGFLQVTLININLEYATTLFACLVLFIYVQKRDINFDYLTGILNRRGIDMALDKAIVESKDKQFAAVMVDVDYFKKINDKFGHKAGDEVLENIAGVLLDSFDKNDVVGRLGGDEFCIITQINDEDELEKRLDDIKDSVASLDWSNKGKMNLSISTGAAVYPKESGMKVKDFLEYIDKRMYEEKLRHHKKIVVSRA